MTLDKRHDIEVDNVWPKLASNSTAFSWSIKDNGSIFSDKQQQRTNVSNRGEPFQNYYLARYRAGVPLTQRFSPLVKRRGVLRSSAPIPTSVFQSIKFLTW